MGGDRLDPAMMEELEKKAEKKKQKTAERMIRALKKHPVMEENIDFKGKFGLDLTDQRVLDLKKIFAIADYSGRMSIGRKQFVDLMKMLGIDPTDEELEDMMNEMDTDGDGDIGFEEFAVAIQHTYDDDMITQAAETEIGAMGTRMWDRGEIVWCINSNIIIMVLGIITVILVHFIFILVPLTLAYFLTFLLTPLMNVFEQRPLECRGKSCCNPKDIDRSDPAAMKVTCTDLATVGRIPHGISVLATLFLFFGVLIFLVYLVAAEMGAFLDDPEIQENMEQLKNDFDQMLNDSGIIVLSPPICENLDQCPGGTSAKMATCFSCPVGPFMCPGPKGIACEHDGYTKEDIGGFIGAFSDFFSQFSLVMLFVIYLMFEKNPDEKMFKGDSPCLEEIEHMIDHYIGLKTMLSFVTGCIVAIILLVIGIKLAVLFGIMSFVLNYIPNVGSVIAMVLPTPVVLLDSGLEPWQKVMAFVGPGAVQGYVGNVLEPTVFGASLNMTPLSILGALVMWGSIWGLPGAVLSVPMLGIQKIVMVYTNHPFAKLCLMLIREDPTLDEDKERASSGV